MNWYRIQKQANAQLGMNLGKWLVLHHQGQHDEIGVKNDIMQNVQMNPGSIDTDAARNAAVNFFVNQIHQQPTVDEGGLLDQWLSMIDGGPQQGQITDDPMDPMGNMGDMGVNNEVSI